MPCSSAAEQVAYDASQSREHVDKPQEGEKRDVQEQAVVADLVVGVLQRDSLVDDAD